MHRGVANPDKAESLAREFLHRLQGHLKLIVANHILSRVDLDSHNLPFVPTLKPRPEALIHPFPFALKSMDVIAG